MLCICLCARVLGEKGLKYQETCCRIYKLRVKTRRERERERDKGRHILKETYERESGEREREGGREGEREKEREGERERERGIKRDGETGSQIDR